MKTLKITFLLLAVVLLTISGQSSETVSNDAQNDANTMDVHIVAHKKAQIKLPEQNG